MSFSHSSNNKSNSSSSSSVAEQKEAMGAESLLGAHDIDRIALEYAVDFDSVEHATSFNAEEYGKFILQEGVFEPNKARAYGVTAFPTFFEKNLLVMELAHAVLRGKYSEVKAILDKASLYPPLLEKLLTTTVNITDHAPRKHVNRTVYQLAIGAFDEDFSKNGKNVIDGIRQLMGSYFFKLPNGAAMKAEQMLGQKPPGWEKKEEERQKNDAEKYHELLEVVRATSDELCQQALALDSIHGYNLCPPSWANNNDEVLASAVYLKATDAGLECRYRILDGTVKEKVIGWDKLPHFPHNEKHIIDPPYQLAPMPKGNVLLEVNKLYVTYDKMKKQLNFASLGLEEEKSSYENEVEARRLHEIGSRGSIQLFDLMKNVSEDKHEELLRALEGGDHTKLTKFLPAILAITSQRKHTTSKETYLPIILDELAEPGLFYTAAQVKELKQLSLKTIKANNAVEFDEAWDKLADAMKKIISPLDLTLLKTLYSYRNYKEPKGVYTTGYHANSKAHQDVYDVYDKNMRNKNIPDKSGKVGFGVEWHDPKNVFHWQKVIGLEQRLSPCRELCVLAQGLWAVIERGEKFKNSLLFSYGGGSILPFDSATLSLGYNCGAATLGPGRLCDVAGASLAAALLENFYRAKTSVQQNLRGNPANNRIGNV
jgi:hypothetical protein